MIYVILLACVIALMAFLEWKVLWDLWWFSREVNKPYEDAQTMTEEDLKHK